MAMEKIILLLRMEAIRQPLSDAMDKTQLEMSRLRSLGSRSNENQLTSWYSKLTAPLARLANELFAISLYWNVIEDDMEQTFNEIVENGLKQFGWMDRLRNKIVICTNKKVNIARITRLKIIRFNDEVLQCSRECDQDASILQEPWIQVLQTLNPILDQLERSNDVLLTLVNDDYMRFAAQYLQEITPKN